MCDRVSQAQDLVNQQAENFCNSLGLLQQDPGQIQQDPQDPGLLQQDPQDPGQLQQDPGLSTLFASLVARTAMDLDAVICTLPETQDADLQLQALRALESSNQEAAQQLESVMREGERVLERVQAALQDIARSTLQSDS